MSDKDAPAEMWDYWSGKYGRVEALEQYYPQMSEKDMRLKIAIAQIKNAHAAIDAAMKDKTP